MPSVVILNHYQAQDENPHKKTKTSDGKHHKKVNDRVERTKSLLAQKGRRRNKRPVSPAAY